MKTSKLIALVMVGLTLSATPAFAQRNGSRSGGGHSSMSSSSSRSSAGSSSRSSFSSGSSRSSSFSSSSRSSSTRSSSSFSTPSSSRSSRSSAVSSNPSSRSTRSNTFNPSSRTSRSAESTMGASSRGVRSESSVRDAATRSSRVAAGSASEFGASRRSAAARNMGTPRGSAASRSEGPKAGAGSSSYGTPVHENGATYARPGRPGGVMPPSHRPIHPAPYFHHPWHHHMVHCHPIFWDPLPPRPWYWPGFWLYCHSYWYDYHVTDVVVVHDYVQQTYNVDLVTYGISGDIMYAIVRDHGDTYLQVYDKDDHLLAEQKINRKYCNMVIDSENGGCWISKKNNKDALLFIWAEGQLLIYEAD